MEILRSVDGQARQAFSFPPGVCGRVKVPTRSWKVCRPYSDYFSGELKFNEG